MKKIGALLLCILLLAGCSKKETLKQINMQDEIAAIQEQFADTIMMDITESDFYAMFELDPSQIKQQEYAFAFLDTRADEICMIQLQDEALAKQVMDIMAAHIEKLKKEFEGYIDAQTEVVNQAIVFTEGNYVFMIVHPKAVDIQDYIISKIK